MRTPTRVAAAAALAVLPLTALAPPATSVVRATSTSTSTSTAASTAASGATSGATSVAAALASAAAARYGQDWTGDGRADVVVAGPDGRLRVYPGDGHGGFLPRRTLPLDWSGYDSVAVLGDWDGDGRPDLLARRSSTGELYVYPGDGHGGLLPRRRVGTGWDAFSQVLAVGDATGDGHPDLLGLRRSDQTLWSYPGTGDGHVGSRRQVGHGWAVRTTLTAVGDLDGDGRTDLVARDARDGRLWLYPGDGRGGFARGRVAGRSGWDAMTALVGPGDWTGDGRADLLARDGAGRLRLYAGTGTGRFARYRVVGTGFAAYRLDGLPGFTSSLSTVSAAQLPSSYRRGCPVPPSDLRRLRVTYYGFDDRAHTGELVVRRSVAGALTRVLATLYGARFPIARMRPVDVYGGSDDRSMAADNTSAFNCRPVAGSSDWSMHAYGQAVDVNTVENPYVVGSSVSPPAGRAFVDRGVYRRGMVVPGGTVVRAFAAAGWGWGGSWSSSKDYQHFSSNGPLTSR